MKSSEHMMVSSKTPQDLEQTTMITRIRQDKAYRIKFVRTLCILFSYITLVGFTCSSCKCCLNQFSFKMA